MPRIYTPPLVGVFSFVWRYHSNKERKITTLLAFRSATIIILALTFGMVFASRRAFWAGLVSYIMIVLGMVMLTSMSLRLELIGSMIMFAIALPFFCVYFLSPEARWWALIPAGVLGTTGLMVTASLFPVLSNYSYSDRAAQALLYLGIAAIFSVLWLRYHQRWASVVVITAVLIASIVGINSGFHQYWPLLAILLGVYMLYSAFRNQKHRTIRISLILLQPPVVKPPGSLLGVVLR
jgi:hypothetical protein